MNIGSTEILHAVEENTIIALDADLINNKVDHDCDDNDFHEFIFRPAVTPVPVDNECIDTVSTDDKKLYTLLKTVEYPYTEQQALKAQYLEESQKITLLIMDVDQGNDDHQSLQLVEDVNDNENDKNGGVCKLQQQVHDNNYQAQIKPSAYNLRMTIKTQRKRKKIMPREAVFHKLRRGGNHDPVRVFKNKDADENIVDVSQNHQILGESKEYSANGYEAVDIDDSNEESDDQILENHEESHLQYSTEQNGLENNLTDEEKLLRSLNVDPLYNSDNEFEEICNFMKNTSLNAEQYSFNTVDLLAEFKDINNSTNEQLLADLLNSPVGVNSTTDNKRCKELNKSICTAVPKLPNTIDKELVVVCVPLDEHSSSYTQNTENQVQTCLVIDAADEEYYETDYDDDDDDYLTPVLEFGTIKKKFKSVRRSIAITRKTIEKLNDLNILVPHEVPIQHTLERIISRAPSPKITSMFEKYAPMKRGRFIQTEDIIIKRNWHNFCEVHNWDSNNYKPFLQLRFKGTLILSTDKAIKFTQFLANGLPNRSLHSVRSRFRLLFEDVPGKGRFNLIKRQCRRRYTPEEDKLIKEYFQDKKVAVSNGLKILSKLLGRSSRSIENRYYGKLKKIDKIPSAAEKIKISHVIWDIPLIEKFLTNLLKLTLSNNVIELKDQVIPTVIWNKMAKEMKISAHVMCNFWQRKLHIQLFVKERFFINDVKVMLIEFMYNKGISNYDEINWQEVNQYFDGVTTAFLKGTFVNLLNCNKYPKELDFSGVIEWLYDNKISYFKLEKYEKYLPRLSYKNGKIKLVDEITTGDIYQYDSDSQLEDSC